ncbi:hypothetical protein GEU84_009110 [Fertoebacter nigrum]|uniref:Rhamnosyl transferase n=1 Tax=Fertoeibacter niger TaxID=2656921 RepID=A0A8X8KN25_9RHOB|nr:glycosyltransferase [Fertoeibacter niger]NUB44540.1 hypothetical protein [Fertoeibacter niger]
MARRDAGADRIQMLGLCRFSLLVDGGFQTMHDTLEARRTALYDPARLANRFAWFEHACLPGFRAQTDGEFTLILLTGTDLPPAWMDRLHDLAASLPQAVVETRDPGPHRDVCRAVMAAHIDPGAQVVGQFRIDDDDTVGLDYIARSREDFPLFSRLYDRHGMLASNYAKGVVATDTGTGLTYETRAETNWACGLTLYFPQGSAKGVMDFGHHRLAEWMPTVTQSDSVMYLRGIHANNDSRGRGLGSGPALPAERAANVLRKRFGIDATALEQALRAAQP